MLGLRGESQGSILSQGSSQGESVEAGALPITLLNNDFSGFSVENAAIFGTD
jgi:hypothetical protein